MGTAHRWPYRHLRLPSVAVGAAMSEPETSTPTGVSARGPAMSEPETSQATDQQRALATRIAERHTHHRQQCLFANFDRPCDCDHKQAARPLAGEIAHALAEQAATDTARIAKLERELQEARELYEANHG